MERGVVFGTGVYGYHLKNGKLTVNEEEAKNVRLIFDLYLNDGMGTHIMCRELENRGIPSPSGSPRWKNASILRMLKNEKYMGTLKQKKFITTNYLTHSKKNNDGEEDFIIIPNNHTPIVDEEIFNEVQIEIGRRRTAAMDKSKHSNRYVWSGKIECANCKSKFKRRAYNRKSGNPQAVWQCSESIKYGGEKLNGNNQKVGCNCKSIREQILQEYLLAALDAAVDNKAGIAAELKSVVGRAIAETPNAQSKMAAISASIAKAGDKKSKLVELFTDRAISRAEFDRMNGQLNKQLEALNADMTALEGERRRGGDLRQRLDRIGAAIESIVQFEEFSEAICKEVLVKVVVESREGISLYINTPDCTGDFLPLSATPPGRR